MKSVQDVRLSWLLLPLLFLVVGAQATEIRDPTVSKMPEINNSSVALEGKLFLDEIDRGACEGSNVDGCAILPWIIKVFADENECLRLDLTRPRVLDLSSPTDLQMIVIHPDGFIYQNGSRSNTDFRPLVKLDIFEAGWYTVVVLPDFDETEDIFFTVRYGRYNAGNPNCANPTQPLISQQAAAMDLTGEQEAAARKAMRQQRNAIRVTPSAEVPEDTE
jgi:hypothetical protein